MRALLLLLSISLLPLCALAKEKSKSADVAEKKIYTEEEFHKKLLETVEDRLKKVGNNKIVDFSRELLEREHQLELKEQQLSKREESFGRLNSDFTAQVKEFGQKQNNFLACLDETEKKEKNRLTHMVDVISGMKPASAAEVLSVQDATISVKILGELSPVKVSKIFNLMDKEISARLQKQYLTMKK